MYAWVHCRGRYVIERSGFAQVRASLYWRIQALRDAVRVHLEQYVRDVIEELSVYLTPSNEP